MKDKIFSANPGNFEELSLEVFRFQYDNNPLYRAFSDLLHRRPDTVRSIVDIPFLPIRFFKSHQITTGEFFPELLFESSGTTGNTPSRHYIKDPGLYQRAFTEGFRLFYGNPSDWCIVGLLPSYLERAHSSLVVMVEELIRLSGHPQSGFYLYEREQLHQLLGQLEQRGQKTWLIGVSFALLDFARDYPLPLQHTVILETGGMKGRREEMIRQEFHDILMKSFSVQAVHSEYGMTELLSQAYSAKDGLFLCPPWMKVLVREEDDPLRVKDSPQLKNGETASGIINVIDLANIYSCAFIATDDAGRLHNNGIFEVAGRVDNSDIRGCSQLAI